MVAGAIIRAMCASQDATEHPHLFRGQLMPVRDGDHLNIVFLHGLHNIVRVCGVTQNGQIDVCNRGTGVDSRQVNAAGESPDATAPERLLYRCLPVGTSEIIMTRVSEYPLQTFLY